MTTQTLTLTDFLLARIAEDEAVANDFIAEGPWQEWARSDMSGPRRDDEYAQLTIGAARVLAECEAKRRIVETWADPFGKWTAEQAEAAREQKERILRALATVYADHDDYRPEWRP